MNFSVVTPAFNGARFIDETIVSVVGQAGPFTIRYHVQDGGSTDGTLDRLARWQARLEAGAFPMRCRGIEFTYASERDGGIYDAINRGFAVCGPSDVMSWINADDRYEHAAFETVASVLSTFPEVQWLCGRICLLDEGGSVKYCPPASPLPRKAIAAGLFDGRSLPYRSFLQQEGMFWRPSLWRKAGGLNPAFRLAGDFDLWRRFAGHAELVVVDMVLGCHREHSAQLTADESAYVAEIGRPRHHAAAAAFNNGRVLVCSGEGGWAYKPPPTLLHAVWRMRRFLPQALSLRRRV